MKANAPLATTTGAELFVVELLPSCPAVFEPQHAMSVLVMRAHVWPPPAVIAVATEKLGTLTGMELFVVVPLPSCPALFEPQHFTPPPLSIAQVWASPAAMALTPLARPPTSRGTELFVVELFPS
jgi:hypothetical protein